MTWQHYQQLKASAQARIAAKLAALQPRGGVGATVLAGGASGNCSIALDSARVLQPEEREEDWVLGIFYTIVSVDGASSGMSERDLAAIVVREPKFVRGFIFSTYAYEQTQFFGGENSRSVTVLVEALTYNPRASWANAPVSGVRNPIYRFPVEVTLDHVIATLGTTETEVAKQERILVRRGGTVIEPQPVNDRDYFVLKVSAVRRV